MGNANRHAAGENEPKSSDQKEENGPHFGGDTFGRIWHPAATFATMKQKTTCCGHCCKFLYVVLGLLTVFLSVSEIAVTVTTAFATKIYSSELSGRLVSMIILAITAAVALSVVLYAIIAVFRKQAKPWHATSAVLIILAIIQAVIAGVSVRVTPDDEVILSHSLTESFRMAREDNQRHVKLWDTTQSDLTCCGVYSPEDYRAPRIPIFFPPDVPISCCPSYDQDRSELVQERAREICKAKKQFYEIGCKTLIVEVFKESAVMVLGVTIALIVLEVLQAILGSALTSKNCVELVAEDQNKSDPEHGSSSKNKGDHT